MEQNRATLQHLSNCDKKKFINSVLTFQQKSKKLKEVQAKYLKLKADWTREMSNFFFTNGIEKAVEFTACALEDTENLTAQKKKFVVRRIQNVSIIFDPDKLEKKLGKNLSKDVINKSYEIIDMQGLTTYLKEVGADPAIFKSFINVHKSVNNEALEQMEKLGKISEKDIENCYTIKKQDPYFTVKEGKGQGDD